MARKKLTDEQRAYKHEIYLRRTDAQREKYRAVNRENMRRYRKANRERLYRKMREDVPTRIAALLRTRLSNAIKRGFKGGSAVRDLGCTIEELKAHLESLFKPGMTWDNWGHTGDVWHLDHIIPLASFDLTDPEQVKLACHYTNLQPLWATENLQKGARC